MDHKKTTTVKRLAISLLLLSSLAGCVAYAPGGQPYYGDSPGYYGDYPGYYSTDIYIEGGGRQRRPGGDHDRDRGGDRGGDHDRDRGGDRGGDHDRDRGGDRK